MLWVFLILALAIIGFIAIFVIALVVIRKVGLVDDGTFAQYSHIATIVGLPLAVIGAIGAIVTTAALLFRDGEPPPHPSPSPTVEMAKTSPRPDLSPSVTPFPSQTPIALVTPTLSPIPPGPLEGRTEETPQPRTTSQDQASSTATQTRYDRGDVGTRKENGYYEITLDNAKREATCRNGFARVSNQEKLITITFSLRAAHLQVPSIASGQDVTTYYVEDAEGQRYQMSCGDGRYFNVSLNSFEGKPKPKSLVISFVVPISAQGLRFRFSAPAGDAIVLKLPNPL